MRGQGRPKGKSPNAISILALCAKVGKRTRVAIPMGAGPRYWRPLCLTFISKGLFYLRYNPAERISCPSGVSLRVPEIPTHHDIDRRNYRTVARSTE
jgi:hypothetical protein